MTGILLIFLGFSTPAMAWDEHWLITQAALGGQKNLQEKSLKVTAFAKCLRDIGFQKPIDFNTSIKIHKAYSFPFKAEEKVGQTISPLKVLSVYSDEPDWGMDKLLFTPDQYPELWEEKFKFMGGQKGTPSQAFRHMYWQKWTIRSPIQSFRLPPFAPMGEGGIRAQIFIELSRKARAAGHPYWGVRFLADALHYLEDVANPFHSNQTPTKKFVFMPFFDAQGSGFHSYVHQVTQIITYYHFSFERYIGRLMMDREKGHGSAEANSFVASLESGTSEPDWSYDPSSLHLAIEKMAEISSHLGDEAGRAGMEFFPKIEVPFANLDPDALINGTWWKTTLEQGSHDSEAKRNYFNVVNRMFGRLGFAIRAVVNQEKI